MQPKRNNYIGQYKKKDTIDGSFDQYWSKYCSDVKDDSIRSVLESVFNVLNDDIKLTRKASDKNQSIFDFYEYIDLMKVLKQSLDLYLGIDDNELEGRVDTARKRIKNQFVQQFNEAHEKLKKEYQESLGVSEEQTDDSESKEKLSERIKESIQNFFDKKKQEKEQESKDKEGESEEKKNQPRQVEIPEKKKQDKEDKNKSKRQISDFEKRLSGEKTDDSVKNVDKTKNADLSSLGKRIMGIIGKVVGIGKRTEKSKKKYKFKKTGSLFGQSSRKKVKFKNKNIEKLRRIVRYGELRGKRLFKKTILSSFKSIKKGIQSAFGMVFGVFGAILSPIGNVVKGTLNAIVHPIQTIKKFASSGLFGIIKTMMKSPSSAYLFGLFLGILYYKFIEPPLNRYIILPFLNLEEKFLNNRLEKLSGDEESDVEKKIEELKSFFEPRSGLNLIGSILTNIAEKLGVSGLEDTFKIGKYLAHPLFKMMINLLRSGLYDYYAGGGLIQKIMILTSAQIGSMFGDMVGEKKDTLGEYNFVSSKIDENVRASTSEMSEDEGLKWYSPQTYSTLRDAFYAAQTEDEVSLPRVFDLLQVFPKMNKQLRMTDIEAFLHSPLIKDEHLEAYFRSLLNGKSFETLRFQEQLEILKKLYEVREQAKNLRLGIFSVGRKMPAHQRLTFLLDTSTFGENGQIDGAKIISDVPQVRVQTYTTSIQSGTNIQEPDIQIHDIEELTPNYQANTDGTFYFRSEPEYVPFTQLFTPGYKYSTWEYDPRPIDEQPNHAASRQLDLSRLIFLWSKMKYFKAPEKQEQPKQNQTQIENQQSFFQWENKNPNSSQLIQSFLEDNSLAKIEQNYDEQIKYQTQAIEAYEFYIKQPIIMPGQVDTLVVDRA